ncbi:MAG: DUF4974 domain-containing protein, partial [Bacteroidota bacterium]
DWMEGKFTFNNASYRDVLDEVERQFDLKVKAEDIEGRTFTGTFYNRDILTALRAVTEPMGLEYEETEPGVIVLR